MKFIVNGHEVEFTACTAIAASIGDTERQNALFVHDCDDEFGDGDSVIFGVDMPETDEEAAALMCEPADSYKDFCPLEVSSREEMIVLRTFDPIGLQVLHIADYGSFTLTPRNIERFPAW